MILWSDPANPEREFLMSVIGPDRAGWHEALVQYEGEEKKETLQSARKVLKEQGFYRPRDRWYWEKESITYMRSNNTYYKLKVRRKAPEGEEEE
jgi:hypothetical protein